MKFSPKSVDGKEVKENSVSYLTLLLHRLKSRGVRFTDLYLLVPGLSILLLFQLDQHSLWPILVTVFTIVKLYYRNRRAEFSLSVLFAIIIFFLPFTLKVLLTWDLSDVDSVAWLGIGAYLFAGVFVVTAIAGSFFGNAILWIYNEIYSRLRR